MRTAPLKAIQDTIDGGAASGISIEAAKTLMHEYLVAIRQISKLEELLFLPAGHPEYPVWVTRSPENQFDLTKGAVEVVMGRYRRGFGIK